MELQAVCNGTPSTIQLIDTGLLSVSSGCTARNSEISISTFSIIISHVRKGYAHFGNLIEPNTTQINIPENKVQEDKDLDDLQLTLNALNKQELPDQISSVQHHHIAAYAVLVVSVLVLLAYTLRKQRFWTLQSIATRNEAAITPVPSASPRQFTLDLDDG
ncbi:GH22158 [Drosophila grimshawi]|uniref:GH22158 n=1 Tax=Drosophila grimshawi TaxID=7222 RepID=B4J4P6_DROGR|nr:GH22158 [Drosophila grimshawi]